MKTLILSLALSLLSGLALASDFNQEAIELAQQQDHAEIYRAGEGAPDIGRLYSTYSKRINWKRGYTSVFIGRRKSDISTLTYAEKITSHIDIVLQTFSSMGLRGYFFVVYGDYEIAFQNWTSESDAQKAFETPAGKSIAQDAGTFMNASMFGASRNFIWLNSVEY